MSLNKLNGIKSIEQQRESLLEFNPDLLYGVYSLKSEKEDVIELDFLDDVLTCYPNQLENLKGIEENSDITIVDLSALRKLEINTLKGKEKNITNPVLLSNGVIEFAEAKNKNGKKIKHFISTLRDGGAADKLQRTTTAGRCYGCDLQEDLEKEHIEESPFLGYDKDGNFALATSDNSEKSKKLLRDSIKLFLERKYLKEGDENYEFVKKIFERNFKPIKYNELNKILNDIIENDRILTYSSIDVEELDGLEGNMKEVKLGNSNGKYFVYFDKDNNTVEYRLLRTITGFNDGFRLLRKRPTRLYLESENQYPNIPRIDNVKKGYVPTVKEFSEKVSNILN